MTARLKLRLPIEGDRCRFVELFTDDAFMAFADGPHDRDQANRRVDTMLVTGNDFAFAKQPIIEQSSNTIIGYAGVAWFDFDGERVPEFGYRLAVEARGKGYATEAALALIDLARQTYRGTVYAMIAPTNQPSMRVIDKLGFTFWKQFEFDGYLDNWYRIELP